MTRPTNEIALDALAAEIRTEHDAVHLAAQTATEHAIRCGELLAEAKDGLAHGQWLPWLRDHCALSERTAQAYMRLARKHGELDGEKAQRVADLPVREAMKAIGDERGQNPVPVTPYRCSPPNTERVWGWAEKQIGGPFNKFDVDNHGMAQGKLLRQAGVSSLVAFCISTMTKEIPMLRLVPSGEFSDAIGCLAPVAKGDLGGLDIDYNDIGSEAMYLTATLTIDAQRACGALLRELNYRRDASKGSSLEEYAEQHGQDFDRVIAAFLENCDAKLPELGEAA